MAQINAVNQHAVKRYAEFEFAMQHVAHSLDDTETLIRTMAEELPGRVQGFKVPSKKELTALRKKALDALDVLRRESKKYEAELVSRGWRV